MLLDKAIEILKDHSELILVDKNPDLKPAMKLGIEALKKIDFIRTDNGYYSDLLLPGETVPTDSP